MANPLIPISFMAFVFGLHIVLVNIDIGLAIIIPILKRLGEIRGNQVFVDEARKYMRYFAIIYATAGVFGTAFTVFLLSFFPTFLKIAGIVLLFPFGFAVIFLILRLFSISAYWYTWYRLKPNYHFYLGLVLAATSFLVPFTFRTVFAFLNNPVGVESLSPLQLNWGKMFSNPTLPPLYLKSIVGALAGTLFTLVTIYTYRLYKGLGDVETNKYFIRRYLSIGMWFLLLQFVLGFWYIAALSAFSPYKFSNIFGVWFGSGPIGGDYSLLFVFKMLLVAFQVFVVLYILYQMLEGEKDIFANKNNLYLLMGIGPAALLTILVGEYLNAFSQLPYFIAVPELENQLPVINVSKSLNELAALIDIYAIAIFALIPLILAFLVLLYYILWGRISESY